MKRLLALLCFILLFATDARADAATVYFDPQDSQVGTNAPFTLDLDISADAPVGAISLTVVFPPGLTPIDVSDGDSIIPLWIDRPTFDPSTRSLTFSGMIPGGFSGTGARLLAMSVQASMPGPARVYVDTSRSEAYIASPSAEPDTVTATPLDLVVSAQRQNISNPPPPDTPPPESFTPVLVQLPDQSGNESWEVAFAAVDKGSGIDHYEVREVDERFPWFAEWHTTQSPYLLTDQTLGSRIDVRAIDKAGNVREESIPASTSPDPFHSFIIIVVFAGLILIGIRILWSRNITKNR